MKDSAFWSCVRNPWVLCAIAAALLLRVFRLDEAAIWLDETFTASWVTLPWGEMLKAALADNHLPLYFILVKAWTLLAGDSPWALRFVSVIFCCAAVPVIAAIAYSLSGKTAAIWAAWLTALSPFLVHHGQEARMYPLFAFIASINVLLLARFLQEKSGRLQYGYILTNVAMLATHYYSVFLIAVALPILFVLTRQRWRDWVPALVLSLIFCIGPVLSAKYLATPVAGGEYVGIELIAIPGMIWGLLTGYTLMPSSEDFHRLGIRALYPYVPIVILVLGLSGFVIGTAIRNSSITARVLLLGVLCGVLLGPLAISSVFEISINPRYATAGAPAFIVLLAIGLAQMSKLRFGKIVTATMLMLVLGASAAHLVDPGHGREDIFGATRWLNENVPDSEEILFTSHEFQLLSDFHWPRRKFTLYPTNPKNINPDNVKSVAANLPLAGSERVIFLIGREWVSDPHNLLESELRGRYGNCGGTSVRGIRILCLTSPGPR